MSVTGGIFIQIIHSTGTYHAFLHAFLPHFLFIILQTKGMFTAIRSRRMVERMAAGEIGECYRLVNLFFIQTIHSSTNMHYLESISKIVQMSLGPKGMDKIFVSQR